MKKVLLALALLVSAAGTVFAAEPTKEENKTEETVAQEDTKTEAPVTEQK